MLVNTIAGLGATGAMERDLMRSYGAGYAKTFVKVRLPNALSFIFNALKINSTLALIGAIVAEFFGTPIVGMSFRISTDVGRMNIDTVWATIAVAALAGSAFYGLLALLERGVTVLSPEAMTAAGEPPGVPGNGEGERTVALKRLALLGAAAVLALSAGTAAAKDKVTLQLKWVTQAQFAGYFVAKDKGFYGAVGLDVAINPGGPDIAPPQVIAGGAADVIVEWMPAALAAREKGVALVNISQTFEKSGMMLTCRKDSGVTGPDKFPGRTLGVWFFGNEYPFLSWMAKLGLSTKGGAKGVTVLKQGFNVDPLLQKQAACISTMTYNEYWQVVDAGFAPEDLVVFKYADQGVQTLEDGLYVLENRLKDAKFVDRMARFVVASNRGWAWARSNPDAAAKIVLNNDETGEQTEKHQKRMMGEIVKLLGTKELGKLVEADYERTVEVLLGSASTPVISKRPEGAWTHAVFDASKAYMK